MTDQERFTEIAKLIATAAIYASKASKQRDVASLRIKARQLAEGMIPLMPEIKSRLSETDFTTFKQAMKPIGEEFVHDDYLNRLLNLLEKFDSIYGSDTFKASYIPI
jgi:hypothetical protein